MRMYIIMALMDLKFLIGNRTIFYTDFQVTSQSISIEERGHVMSEFGRHREPTWRKKDRHRLLKKNRWVERACISESVEKCLNVFSFIEDVVS